MISIRSFNQTRICLNTFLFQLLLCIERVQVQAIHQADLFRPQLHPQEPHSPSRRQAVQRRLRERRRRLGPQNHRFWTRSSARDQYYNTYFAVSDEDAICD